MTGSIRAVILKLALFTALTLSLTGLLAAVIGNIQPFTRFYAVEAEFSDATGLLKQDLVKIAGVTVGKVAGSEIAIDPRSGRAKAVVTILIRNSVDVPRNAHAAIRFRNLLGQRMVVITRDPERPQARPLTHNGKAVLPLAQTSPAFDLGIVFNNLRPVLQTLDPRDVNTVSRALVEVFGGREARVHKLVSDLADVSEALGRRGPIVTELVTNLSSVASTVAAHDDDLRSVLDSLDALLSSLGPRAGQLARALDDLGVASEGTARILEDNRPALDRTIAKLASILDVLAAHKNELDAALQTLPKTTDALNRATTYGEWTNLSVVCLNGICGPGFESLSTSSDPLKAILLAAGGTR